MINFVELYNQSSDIYFQKKNEERGIKEQTSWYISGFGTCKVHRYLRRMGILAETAPDRRLREVFDIGNVEEDLILNRLKLLDSRYVVDTQGYVRDDKLGVSGKWDLKITDTTNDEKHIVEIKSKHSKAFWYMDKKGEGANSHHKMQLWWYLHLEDIDSGTIFYRSKDDRMVLGYPIFKSDLKVKSACYLELAILNTALKLKVAPPLPTPLSWEGKYCDTHAECKKYVKEHGCLTDSQIKSISNDLIKYIYA